LEQSQLIRKIREMLKWCGKDQDTQHKNKNETHAAFSGVFLVQVLTPPYSLNRLCDYCR
jgi:hypothetical protein